MQSFTEYFVGVVRLPAANLFFLPTPAGATARLDKADDVLKLVKVFQDTGLDPSRLTHQIFGVIQPSELQKLRKAACLSPDNLLQTALAGRPPLVSGDFQVQCMEGRRRVEAAKLLLGESAWWTIRLHCMPDGQLSRSPIPCASFNSPSLGRAREKIIRTFAGSFSHEAAYSDGEIYYNLRCYQKQNNDLAVRAWKAMLSQCKARAWDHLLPREDILNALDKVMSFPGLRSGLQLGNIDKHLATHCDEQIVQYLDHVYRVWDLICQGNVDRMAIDDSTVRLLQFRVPSVSRTDGAFVSTVIDTGLLFSTIVEPRARKRIYHALLSLRHVIPSLETFHENMKYLSIGAKILKKHLDIPPKRTASHGRDTTLYQRLTSHWNPACLPLVEVGEGRFLPIQGPACPGLAFKQLFVSVLRQFPFLSTETALRDFRAEAMPAYTDQYRLRQLLRRAKTLGYENIKIFEGLQRAEGHIDLVKTPFEAILPNPLAEWRGGKPFVRTLLALEKTSFLLTLQRAAVEPSGVTAEFVQNDLLNAFFGTYTFQIDTSRTCILEDSEAQSPVRDIVKDAVEGTDFHPPDEEDTVMRSEEGVHPSVAERVVRRSTSKTVAARAYESAKIASKKLQKREEIHEKSLLRRNRKIQRRKTEIQQAGLASYLLMPRRVNERSALEVPTSAGQPELNALASKHDQEVGGYAEEDTPVPAQDTALSEVSEGSSENGSIIQSEAPLHLNAELNGTLILPQRNETRAVPSSQFGDGREGNIPGPEKATPPENRPESYQVAPRATSKRTAPVQDPLTMREHIIVPGRAAKRLRLSPDIGEPELEDVPLSPLQVPQTARLPTFPSIPRTPIFCPDTAARWEQAEENI